MTWADASNGGFVVFPQKSALDGVTYSLRHICATRPTYFSIPLIKGI